MSVILTEKAGLRSAKSISGSVLLINSISPLRSPLTRKTIASAVLEGQLSWNDIFVYLHEDEYVFRRVINEGNGEALEFLTNVNVVPLTDSLRLEYQARGWKCTDPVYNTIRFRPYSTCALPGGCGVNILIVASFQTRKGVDRVTKLATAAHDAGQDINFHWIGPHSVYTAELPDSYPENFMHWGPLSAEHIQHLLPAFDCMLLPSYSDPLPLSIWEAVLSHRKCFVSEEVGTSELDLSDSVVTLDFNKDPEQLLEQLIAETKKPVSGFGVYRLLELIEPKAFHNHVSKAIGRPDILPLIF